MQSQILDDFFQELKNGIKPSIWSKGVESSRYANIFVYKKLETQVLPEYQFKIKDVKDGLFRSVLLELENQSWLSDCGCNEDPCSHILACAIALKQALDGKLELQVFETQAAKIGYKFFRQSGALALKRVCIVPYENELPITSSLAMFQRKNDRVNLVLTSWDHAIDILWDDKRQEVLSGHVLSKIFQLLEDTEEPVFLDNNPIKLNSKPRGALARVEDIGGSVKLFGIKDTSIQEIFSNGIILVGLSQNTDGGFDKDLIREQVLCPIHQPKLSQDEITWLTKGRLFGQKEMVELASVILPQLRKKIYVENFSRQLPGSIYIQPHVEIKTWRHDLSLSIEPRIVYGELAEVIAGRLIPLSMGKNDRSESMIPIRDINTEQKLESKLMREFSLVLGDRKTYNGRDAVEWIGQFHGTDSVYLTGEDYKWFRREGRLAFTFANEDLQELILENSSEKDNRLKEVLAQSFKFSITGHQQNSFEGDSVNREETFHADPVAVVKAWQQGESLVPLLGGGWAEIPRNWLDRFGGRLESLLAAKNAGATKALVPEIMGFLTEQGSSESQSSWIDTLKKYWEQTHDAEESKLPAHLETVLRDYQKDGVQWLMHLRQMGLGALLADDMGLGKTLQAICAVRAPALVVAPTSVLYNWKNEFTKFRPELDVTIYHGGDRSLDGAKDVVLTSYSLLRRDCELLAKKKWQVVILDESQNIKNPESQSAQSAFKIDSVFRIALSGTPVENKLDDAWSQFQFVLPGFLGTRKDFLNRYAKPIMAGDLVIAKALRERLAPFLKRRLKDQVAKELPKRTDMIVYCELSPEEQEFYNVLRVSTQQQVKDVLAKSSGRVLDVLELLLRLRQASCHPGLLPGSDKNGSGVPARTSAKLERLLASLQECIEQGHKALVFSQWTSFLNIIGDALNEEEIPYLRIDGSTNNRQEIVDRFQSGDHQENVMLLSLKAAGVGLNLTAADYVFIMDPWWNPAAEDQAADRAHRIGQDKPVFVNKLVAKDTVEEKIILLQEAKRALSQSVVDSGGAGGTLITKEELLALLE